MTPGRRRLLGGLAAAALAVVLAVGVTLAVTGDADERAPVAVANAPNTAPGPAAGGEVLAGRPAPKLSGTDPITGDRVSLADFRGKPVVLNFWASWCGPCTRELPALQKFADSHPEVAVLGVNFQDGAADARRLQGELGFTFPSIADPRGELGAKLGIPGMPTTFFLTRDHRIVGLIAGGTDLAGFEQGLELAERSSA